MSRTGFSKPQVARLACIVFRFAASLSAHSNISICFFLSDFFIFFKCWKKWKTHSISLSAHSNITNFCIFFSSDFFQMLKTRWHSLHTATSICIFFSSDFHDFQKGGGVIFSRGQIVNHQGQTKSSGAVHIYRVLFLTGTPPKSSKYKKVNLG